MERSDLNLSWKELPAKRRLILLVLLMAAVQALLYLFLDLPGSTGEVPVGGITASGVLLGAGSAFVALMYRWTSLESGTTSRPRSGQGQHRRVIQLSTVLAVVAYLLLLVLPQPLFPHTTSHGEFVVHADRSLGREIHEVLDKASTLLASSPAYDSTGTQTLYLTRNRVKFFLFAREHFGAFAIRSPLGGAIFIADALPAQDLARSAAELHNTRSLSSVVAHEAMHNYLRALPNGRELPTWKEEGYADYVAKESSYDCRVGVRSLLSGQNDQSDAFRYFKYRMLVIYLLNVERVSFNEFLSAPHDPRQLEPRVVHWLRAVGQSATEVCDHLSRDKG